MFYSNPTTRECISYTDTETALTPEKTSRTMGEVATKTLALDDILNSLPEVSSSDPSSEE